MATTGKTKPKVMRMHTMENGYIGPQFSVNDGLSAEYRRTFDTSKVKFPEIVNAVFKTIHDQYMPEDMRRAVLVTFKPGEKEEIWELKLRLGFKLGANDSQPAHEIPFNITLWSHLLTMAEKIDAIPSSDTETNGNVSLRNDA